MKGSQKELRLALDYARSLLSYDPDSGIFIWLTNRGNGYASDRIGTVAGRLDRFGYLQIGIDQVRYRAHRLAWFFSYGRWPREHVDHANGVTTDNRLANLRECDARFNSENQRAAQKNNSCGVLGVTRNPYSKSKPFKATITVNRKSVHLGCFATAEEAHEQYLAKKRELHAGCTI